MRFKEFLVEKAVASSAKIALDFQVSIPIKSEFHVGLSDKKSFEETARLVAESLSEHVDAEVKVKKTIGARSKSLWIIKPSTASDKSGAHAMTISSPPLQLHLALKTLDQVSEWLDENSLRTADNTSLTAAVTVPNIKSALDPVKLVMFMGETSASAAFSKQNSRYSDSQIEIISHTIKTTGRLPSNTNDLKQTAISFLGSSHKAVNLDNVEDGYVEFKASSGAGYEHDIEATKKKIYRLASAVEIACDPSAERSEYLRKIQALFKRDVFQKTKAVESKDLPIQLQRFNEIDTEIGRNWKHYSASSETGDSKISLLVLINRIMIDAKKLNSSLNRSEISFIKGLLKHSNLQNIDIDKYFGNDHIKRLNFKKEFGL